MTPLYSREHTWAARVDARIRVGISRYAQEELGEVAFVELPELGRELRAGEAACVIDSLKSTSEVYAPVSGRVVAVNEALRAEKGAALLNEDPLGRGWIYEVEDTDRAELASLMSEERYGEYLGSGSGDPRAAR